MLAPLLRAMQTRLRTASPNGLGLAESVCAIMADGRPAPGCGKWFYSIHGQIATARMHQQAMEQTYQITVTLTCRVEVAFDHLGQLTIARETTGLWARADRLIEHLVQNRYALLTEANTLIGVNYASSTSPRHYLEPLDFRAPAQVRIVPGSWFHSDTKEAIAGLAVDLVFAGGKRIEVMPFPGGS